MLRPRCFLNAAIPNLISFRDSAGPIVSSIRHVIECLCSIKLGRNCPVPSDREYPAQVSCEILEKAFLASGPRCPFAAQWRDSNADQPCHPRHPLLRIATSILLLMAASCAEPPATASVAIPPIPPQQARIWFYRRVDTAAENMTTPYIRLNGAIAGAPEQGRAFHRDVPPGHYQITVDSQGMSPNPSREVALAAGEQIYARIGLGASWNGQGFSIRLGPTDVSRAAIEHSKFYGGRAFSSNPAGT